MKKSSEHNKHHVEKLPKANAPMTLDEMRLRLMINSMKIKIEQQKMLTAILPGATPVETAVENNISRVETIMQYATLAVTTYRMTKKAIDLVKSFKNNK